MGYKLYTELVTKTGVPALVLSFTVNSINRPNMSSLLFQVHIEGAERLARISKEMGVEKFIHVSALNSNIEHEVM